MAAVFQPTGNFSFTGMKAAAEDTLDITFRLTTTLKCPSTTNPELQPRLSILRRNCDGTVRRGIAPTTVDQTTAVCAGDGVYKAVFNVPFIRSDACFGVHIKLADG
jgi:hypothetical protein